MPDIIAFAGSNRSTSINKQLVTFAAQQLQKSAFQVLDLNDFPLPLYGIDLEKKEGYPEKAQEFNRLLENSDGILLSLAEHNGSYSAVFKNLFDWLSRIDKMVWKNKPMLLMSTSPGGRGGQSVREAAMAKFPRMGAEIVRDFSLPFFKENFANGKITKEEFLKELQEADNTVVQLIESVKTAENNPQLLGFYQSFPNPPAKP